MKAVELLDVRIVVKDLAKRFRAEDPTIENHGNALKAVANKLGFKDWNVLSAICNTDPTRVLNLLAQKGLLK